VEAEAEAEAGASANASVCGGGDSSSFVYSVADCYWGRDWTDADTARPHWAYGCERGRAGSSPREAAASPPSPPPPRVRSVLAGSAFAGALLPLADLEEAGWPAAATLGAVLAPLALLLLRRRTSRASGRSPSEGFRAEASREGLRAEASRPQAAEGAAGSAGASCGAEAGGGSPAACSSKAGLAAEKAAEEAEGAAEGAAARATLLGRGRRSLTRLLSAALGVGAQLLRPRRIEHARDAGSYSQASGLLSAAAVSSQAVVRPS